MYKGKNNVWMTQSLFWDMWVQLVPANRHADPVFTFDSDRPGLINFKRTFVETGDPTGYEWAMKYLDSYDHLIYLLKREWFSNIFEKAKAELFTKLKAQAIKRITTIATESANEGQALAASKYLHELDKNKVGRPSKEKLKGELRRAVEEAEAGEDDLNRMKGLSVIQGGK